MRTNADNRIENSERKRKASSPVQVVFDEVTTLEYSFLKVPYEIFNKRFRTTQKTMEKHNFYIREMGSKLLKAFESGESSEMPCVHEVKPLVAEYVEKLDSLSSSYTTLLTDEESKCRQLEARINHLKQGKTDDEIDRTTWCDQRVSRLIIDYLLRAGYFETAQNLSEQAKVEDLCNKAVFEVAKQVEDSLAQHKTDRCLEWVIENKSKLRKLKSPLEVEVRLQDCIELVKKGERLSAIHYARKHFSGLPKEQWIGDIVKVMGLIGFGIQGKGTTYEQYFSENRWDTLIEKFRQENARVFKLMDHSLFNACLCVGLSASKTAVCHPGANDDCVACRPDMYELAKDLPCAHVTHSRLICHASGEPMCENGNEPMMLPNGYVYGSKAIPLLCNENNEVVCPRTGASYPSKELARIYIM